MSQHDLILVRGAPGAGKSTVASLFQDVRVFSADDYMLDGDGNYKFQPEKLKACHEYCREYVKLHMLTGRSRLAVANTFTQEWEMQPYIELAEKYGYRLITLIVENRHGSKSLHNVPEDKMQQMKERFEIVL